MLTFAAPAAAWLFALLIPLAAFYFLKLRRPRQEVSSLALWRQVLNDQRVNSPFQRFKRNLLLLLQILLLAALALAAMRPAVRRGPTQAKRLPVLIDCSASMGALDHAGGVSRLEAAKRRVRDLIANLLPGQEISLIAFAKAAHKLTGFTDDQRLLRTALDALQIEDVPGDLEDALRLAQALARTTPFDEALVLSDGNFPAQTHFELSFKVDYQRLPSGGPNLGLVACNARRSAAESKWEVFVEVEASASESEGASVELSRDGTLIGSERLAGFSAQSGKPTARLSFSVDGSQAAALKVRLAPDGFDSLASDNTAYLDLPAARPLSIYAVPALGSWRHALRALEGVRLFPPDDAAANGSPPTPAGYDLAITDQRENLPVNARTVCTVGVIPEDLEKLIAVEQTPSGIVDWRRDSPLLQHVELTDLILSERPTTHENISEGDYANLGYDILAQGSRGPLLVEKLWPERLGVHLLFHTDRSTLPYRVGFPIFVANLMQAALKQSGLSEAEANRTGALAPMNMQPGRRYEVRGPDGAAQTVRSDERGALSGISALKAGEYRLSENGADRARVGASLLSPSETGLEATQTIRFNEQLSAAATNAEVKTDRPIWFPLALGAFLLLLAEWWCFHQRPAALAAPALP
jgi:Ca-activated chloride channel family protein